MTTDRTISFALFDGVLALLPRGRFRHDVVAPLALVLGVVRAEDAFAGFGHPAAVAVALVLVVPSGPHRSGAVRLITRTLVDASRPTDPHIALMGGIGGVLSAFMDDVAALAILMPVDIQTAQKAGRLPCLSLVPLSFAAIPGGMATLIGTPPNVIVTSIREDRLSERFTCSTSRSWAGSRRWQGSSSRPRSGGDSSPYARFGGWEAAREGVRTTSPSRRRRRGRTR